MNTSSDRRKWFCASMLVLVLGFVGLTRGWAATAVSGDVFGAWTTNGSPYVLLANCTVPNDQSLTIQPGVTVIVGPDANLFVYGGLIAAGTPDKRIQIRGATETNFWQSIFVHQNSHTNQFRHCRISEASNAALFFSADGTNGTFSAAVDNCEFINCPGTGISGGAVGTDATGSHVLEFKVRNCIFKSVGSGCVFYGRSCSWHKPSRKRDGGQLHLRQCFWGSVPALHWKQFSHDLACCVHE